MKILVKNVYEMQRFAEQYCSSLVSDKQAVVVALFGDLGTGKTTFTQGLAKALGVTETVTSPTFVIEKIYKLDHQAFDHLIHIDAYRLEQSSELARLGWQDILSNPRNIIAIEWPEKVADIMPKDQRVLKFTFIDESTREIEYA